METYHLLLNKNYEQIINHHTICIYTYTFPSACTNAIIYRANRKKKHGQVQHTNATGG